MKEACSAFAWKVVVMAQDPCSVNWADWGAFGGCLQPALAPPRCRRRVGGENITPPKPANDMPSNSARACASTSAAIVADLHHKALSLAHTHIFDNLAHLEAVTHAFVSIATLFPLVLPFC